MNFTRVLLYLRVSCIFIVALLVAPLRSAATTPPYIEVTRPDRGRVFAVVWSPDGKYVAAGTEQGLWLYTDTLTDVLHIPTAPIHALAWSPDGKSLAVGYFGHRATVLSPENRSAGEPSGYLINGGSLQLWTVQSAGQQLTFTPHETLLQNTSVYALRFSPDSSRLASLSQDAILEFDDEYGRDALHIYATLSGKLLYTYSGAHVPILQEGVTTQGANGLAWTADGRYLATIRSFNSDNDAELAMWDSSSEAWVTKASGLCEIPAVDALSAVDWSNVGMLACSGVQTIEPSSDGGVGICPMVDFTINECQLLRPPLPRTLSFPSLENVPTLAWRPGTTQLAYAVTTQIRLWDEATQQPVATLDAARDSVTMLAWNFDGTRLLTSGSDYAIRVWSRFDSFQTSDPTPSQEVTLPANKDDVVISPDGRWIAKIDRVAGRVTVINTTDGHIEDSFPPQGSESLKQAWAEYAQWSPNSKMLALPLLPGGSCGDNYTIGAQIWAAHTGRLVMDIPDATSITWQPDSQSVAVGLFSEKGLFFEGRTVPTGKTLWQFSPSDAWEKHDHSYRASQVSSDGRLLAVDDYVGCGVYDATSVYLWSIRNGTLAARLDTTRSSNGGSGGMAKLLDWSSDGKTAAVLGFDHFYLYHLQQSDTGITPQLLWKRPSHSYLDFDGGTPFSPDAHYLFYGGTIWDAANGWPVFRFHDLSASDVYRWQGNSLLRIDIGASDGSTQGSVTRFNTDDILLKACNPADFTKLTCVVDASQ